MIKVGRLIDAEALVESMCRRCKRNETPGDAYGCVCICKEVQNILRAPTVHVYEDIIQRCEDDLR